MTIPVFPSNSNNDKAEDKPEKKVERVVTSPVSRRKVTMGQRLREVFAPADGQSVMSYVVLDVVAPAVKDMFVDSITQGVERLVFGETSPRRSRSRYSGPGGSSTGRVSYERYSSPSRTSRPIDREESRTLSRRDRSTHNFDSIVLDKRVEADEVLNQLYMLLDKYNLVTVADLYGMVGIDTVHTDNKYGWVDLRTARVQQIRGGYLLDLPRPEPID